MKKINIGDTFRLIEDNKVYRGVLVYNRLDEDTPYTVVNTTNYEVIDAYPNIGCIPLYDLIPNIASKIIGYQKDGEVLTYSIDGDKISLCYYNSLFDSYFYVLDEEVSKQESLRLQSLFHAFGISQKQDI